MEQKGATLTEHVDAFKREALLLLRYYIAWKRIIKFEDIKEISRIQLVDKMISLKCIENDLIVRISKFDDNDKRVHSFQRALLKMPSSHKDKAAITKKVKDFQTLIKKVKQRRHKVLAHLKVGSEDNFEPTYDLLAAIKLLVEIIDLIAGQNIGYAWSDGRYEKYDLRKEVLDETTL